MYNNEIYLLNKKYCRLIIPKTLLASYLAIHVTGTMRDARTIDKVSGGLATLVAHENLARLTISGVRIHIPVLVNGLVAKDAGLHLIRFLILLLNLLWCQ